MFINRKFLKLSRKEGILESVVELTRGNKMGSKTCFRRLKCRCCSPFLMFGRTTADGALRNANFC